MAFDGVNIWVTNTGDSTFTKLQASNGSNLGTFSVGSSPLGVAFDGANIWVANSQSNTVTKMRASDGSIGGMASPNKLKAGRRKPSATTRKAEQLTVQCPKVFSKASSALELMVPRRMSAKA